jgi:NADPH:quinone reductase-like Zn-dependent oxidoreductase
MKAIVLREFGGPEVLRLEEVSTPTSGPDDVLIRVHSVSVNRTLDLIVRQGKYRTDLRFPVILGVDPAGEVAAVGPRVQELRIGDRVAVVFNVWCRTCRYCLMGEESNCPNCSYIGLDRWGGYAEYVAVPAYNAFHIPDGLSFPEATVITRHFPMAFNLADKANLQSGEWVLIMGAAGALGSCAVQVAKLLGANIIAATGSDERVTAALSYGAHFGVNYRRQDLAKEVLKITEGRGADVVFENIADPTLWPSAFNSLGWNGRLVTAGAHGGGHVTLDVKRLYLRRIRIIGVAGTNRRDVDRAFNAATTRKVRATIDRVMPLGEAAIAHQVLEQNQILGKIILNPTLV